MNREIKRLFARGLYSMGLQVTRVKNRMGLDPYRDMAALIRSPERPVMIDVGANKGQTVRRFKQTFRNAVVHSFEPSDTTFATLQRKTKHYRDVHLNNFALGDRRETRTFLENTRSTMSSFLEPSEYCWGEIETETSVEVRTLDDYAAENGIEAIDVLKTDTQGFDLEVLKGARSLMERKRVHMVYTEVIFTDMYKGMPPFDEFFRFMLANGFKLVSFYRFYHQHNQASWSDSLFVNNEFDPG